MLARVQEHSEGELEIDDFLDSLMMGEMQLWIATEDNQIVMSMVTMVVNYPQKRILRVVSISGERFKELHEKFNDMVEAFAIKKGCSALELWGRKGWKKMLPDWKDSYIVFTKDLKERMH
tara:strand:+ start:879 stop:1238 length:360 start_codon:yes stop_codon:yes gene_type:complete